MNILLYVKLICWDRKAASEMSEDCAGGYVAYSESINSDNVHA